MNVLNRPDLTFKRVGTILGYGVLGAAVTAALGLALLNLLDPIQAVIYDLFYLRVGPGEATEVAILAHFLVSGVLAIGAAMFAGEYLSDRGEHVRPLSLALGVMLVLVLAFMVIALLGLAAFLTALVVLAVALIAIPLLIRYRLGVRSGGLPAFIGGIPVIVVFLFLAGFGLGWGWGYIVIAEEVPSSEVDGPVADFDDVPEVRDDLLVAGDCNTESDDRRRCTLQLRGYEHAVTAVRFLDDHGVLCHYPNSYAGEENELFTEHDASNYRVTCSSHGD